MHLISTRSHLENLISTISHLENVSFGKNKMKYRKILFNICQKRHKIINFFKEIIKNKMKKIEKTES